MASCISSTSCPMRIARAELFELTLPLLEPFVISGGAITERRSVVVVLHDDAGHVGYGDRKSTRLNSSHVALSRTPCSALKNATHLGHAPDHPPYIVPPRPAQCAPGR